MNIKRGDLLEPINLWNRTERVRKLANPTEALDVRYDQRGCQTGIMVNVRFVNGGETWLDSAWFIPQNAPMKDDER